MSHGLEDQQPGLPEHWKTLLRLIDRVPFIITTRRRAEARERNAFEIGRDYGRGTS